MINAGDGRHEHPTQALLDAFTLRRHREVLDGLRVAIVGDVRHSRVARSNVKALHHLGAEVTLVAPAHAAARVARRLAGARSSYDLDDVISEVDVVYAAAHAVRAPAGGAVPDRARVHRALRA